MDESEIKESEWEKHQLFFPDDDEEFDADDAEDARIDEVLRKQNGKASRGYGIRGV